jgi:lysophospholipase L1-like esterase
MARPALRTCSSRARSLATTPFGSVTSVRDPANPKQMLPAYDKGDNLHPNDAGYKAMAESIDLKIITGQP